MLLHAHPKLSALWFYWQIIKLVLNGSTIHVYILRLMIGKITHFHYWEIIGWLCGWSALEWRSVINNEILQFFFNERHSLHWQKNASYNNISLNPTPDVPIYPAVDDCIFNFYNVSIMHNWCMGFRRHWCVASAFSCLYWFKKRKQ